MASSGISTVKGEVARADTLDKPQDCLACRVIGTAALGGVGIYALNQSRAHAPGSPMGKRALAGVGLCFLVASALRWKK